MKKHLVAFVLAVFAAPAFAQTGLPQTGGFLTGVAHPFLGLDHVLAMVAVGLWSGFVLPRHVWGGALVFMTAMAAGAGSGWAGMGFPAVETVIVASVVAFGVLTLLADRAQPRWVTGLSLALIAVFATAHGHAHATEAAGNVPAYLAGFLAATAALHLAGIVLARTVATQPLVQRAVGAGIAISGLWMVAG